jgi:hypothetical protein
VVALPLPPHPRIAPPAMRQRRLSREWRPVGEHQREGVTLVRDRQLDTDIGPRPSAHRLIGATPLHTPHLIGATPPDTLHPLV